MYSTVQVVLVLDLNNFMGLCCSESEIEQHIAKIKLVSLKLLLDFGAKTDRAVDGVRWSWKFYNSRTFRPDTSRKQFLDFGKKVFGEFESELTDKYCKTFDNQDEGEPQLECRRPHSFVLKKALQEVLLDYNWDGPDISSPVKTARRRSNGGVNALPHSNGPYNAIIVVANVPRGPEAPPAGSQGNFLAEVLDGAMVKAFQEDKKISLSFVEVQKASDGLQTIKLHADLAKLNGSLRNITDFVQTQPRQVASHLRPFSTEAECGQHVVAVSSQQVQLPWRSGRPGRSRKPQPGPALVWEDAAGISHLSIQLQVLAVYGSCSRSWNSASVVGAVYTSQVALLALAQDTASLYICVANCDTFGALITVLATHQLSLVLRLSCGSLALLSPWGEGAGCLALVSASGLAALAPYMPDCSPSTLQFVSSAVRRCLKDAAPRAVEEAAPSRRWFTVSMTQHWFRPVPCCTFPTPHAKNRLATAPQRRMMLERLQKRYRPQILKPLAAGETGPLDLVDITQPPVEPQQPQATLAKPNMTRAQQLLKKSHIVTAQQKVKEQRAEEEERVQASERRAAQASERALKSQALETQVLNTVSDPQDERKLVESLVSLRETAGVEADIFTTAQTIINVALVHVKNTTITPTPAAATMQEGLGRVLGCGVLQSAAKILSRPQPETHLHQYKLQTLLHLEMLWVLGYSASSKQSEGGEEEVDEEMNVRKEYHVEEVVRLLRAISLHHDPSTMANFLQETVLENYLETLGEVLLEVYEELNQPLPPPLRDLAGDVHSIQSNWPPASVRSQGTPVQYSESPAGSGENPDSTRSKEGRWLRMRPNPSLHEASKRSIVVPKVTRALSRTLSEQPRSCSGQSGPAANGTAAAENSAAPAKNVRRNLFEPGEASKTSPKNRLKRCHTQPTSKKPSVAVSKAQQAAHPSPIKTKSSTPQSKKGGKVLIPETPDNKVGSTVFNYNRCHKSIGTTCIGESPDVKMSCHVLSKTTPRRLQASLTAARRNSFYSGARSRNWERAKTQLLADHIRGHADRRSSDPASQQTPSNTSFLFSDILSASQSISPKTQLTPREQPCRKQTLTPKRRTLDYSLDTCENIDLSMKNNNSVTTKLTVASPAGRICGGVEPKGEEEPSACLDLGHTPVKRVRRALLLGTPSKAVSTSRSPEKTRSTPGSTRTSADFSGFSTPMKTSPVLMFGGEYMAALTQVSDGSEVTHPGDMESTDMFAAAQGKRVHFTLKMNSNSPQTPKRSGTPKSILKTPNKTPSKGSYCSPTVGSKLIGSWRETTTSPCRGTLQEDVVHPSTHMVKVGSLVSHSESEFELSSPTKNVRQDNLKPYTFEQIDCAPKYPMSASKSVNSSQRLSQSPKKFRSISSPSELDESSVASFSSTRRLAKRLDDAKFDRLIQCDSDASPSQMDIALLPNIPEEDINLVSTLLFGNLGGPDSIMLPVLEANGNSDPLGQPATLDDSEVCDSDDSDTPLGSHQLPDLEATVALHSMPEEDLDFECMSPILLPNLREWFSQREGCGDWLEKLDYEKIVAGKTILPFTVVTPKGTRVKNDADFSKDLTKDDGSQENVAEQTDIPLDVAEDTEQLQALAKDSTSAQGLTENTAPSQNVAKDTESLQALAKDSVSSYDLAKDIVPSQDVAGNTVSSQSVAEDAVSSQDAGTDTASSQDLTEDTSSSQDVAEDTSSLQDVAEDTSSSQYITGDTSSSQDVGEDTTTSQDVTEETTSQEMAEGTGVLHDVSEYTNTSQDVPENVGSLVDVANEDDFSQNVAEDTAAPQGVADEIDTSQNMAEDTCSSQELADGTDSAQDVPEYTSSSQEMANGSSQDVLEEVGFNHDVPDGDGLQQNVVKTGGSQKDVVEDGGSQDIAKNTGSLQDVALAGGSQLVVAEYDGLQQIEAESSDSHDVAEDAGSQQDGGLDNDASQVVTEESSFLHDVAVDGSTLQNVAEDGCSFHSADLSARAAQDRDTDCMDNVTESACSVLVSGKDDNSALSCYEDAGLMSNKKPNNFDSCLALSISQGKGTSLAENEKGVNLSDREFAAEHIKVNKNVLEPSLFIEEETKSKGIYKKPNNTCSASGGGGVKMGHPISRKTVKIHKNGKRRMNSSTDEPHQTGNQENAKSERVLRERRRREGSREPRKAPLRACRRLASSLCDLSSDDSEEQEWCRPRIKKRIFEDIDFFTPEKLKAEEVTLPLKNVENLPDTQERLGHIDSANIAESIPAGSGRGANSTLESCIERENSSVVEDASHKWQEQEPSVSTSSLHMSLQADSNAETSKWQPRKARKKKGVKLTLTRSGDQYQVTKTQISQGSSDPNSSGDLDLYLSCSDYNDSLEPSKSSITNTSKRANKRGRSLTLLTPHRFTRHMSRDLSVSPDLYQQLITLSPHKTSKKPKMESKVSKEKQSECSVGNPVCASTPRSHKKSEEWWVSNLRDSPTMKTFVRRQKRKHQITASPRVQLPRIHRESSTLVQENEEIKSSEDWSPLFLKRKPVHYSSPSVQSLLHLSSDKILLDQSPDQERKGSSVTKQQNVPLAGPSATLPPSNLKLRSSRRLLYSGLVE